MNAKEYSNQIIELQKGKDYHGAYEILREALTIYPTNLFFLKSEIHILFRLNRIREAREKAEARMELLKGDPFFLKTYIRILEKEKAKEDLKHLIDNIPSWGIRNDEFYSFLVTLVGKQFGRDKVIDLLKIATMHHPESNHLKDLLEEWSNEENLKGGYGFYREKFKGRKREEVIRELESIMVLPEYAADYGLHHFLADLYKKGNEYDKALKIYNNLLRLKDDEFTRKMLGYLYYKMGDMANALIYLKDIFLNNPYDHFLYRTIMEIFKQSSDYEGFERLVNEALARDPNAKHLYGLLKRFGKKP